MQEYVGKASNAGSRRLVVMRHAKAEHSASADHVRALAERGLGDAEAVGRWMRDHGVEPDAALVSDALRTQQTWQQVAAGAGWDEGIVVFSEALYAAGTDSAFDLLREVAGDVRTLVVIGHNPTMGSLAELVDDGEGDSEATTAMVTRGFPTSAVAVFTFDGAWADLGPGTARLDAFHVGAA
ncbi:SixA phosphatase family protein [Nocardioides sp. P5_E3]